MRKFLIAFGLIWSFIWSAFGLFLGMMKQDEWLATMKGAAIGSDLPQFLESWLWWKGISSIHAHALGFSFLLIITGLILPEMRYSEKAKTTIGIMLTSGVVISIIFGFWAIPPLKGLGAVLVLVSILMSFIGIIQNVNK
jgi:hypothetical protein